LGEFPQTAKLDSGQFYTVNQMVTIPSSIARGVYYPLIYLDYDQEKPSGKLTEYSESNNTSQGPQGRRSRLLVGDVNGLPDLYVYDGQIAWNPLDSVLGSDSPYVFAGDTIVIRWCVNAHGSPLAFLPRNQQATGDVFGTAIGPWKDALFLSRDRTFGDDDILLITHDSPVEKLAPGGRYSPELKVTLPKTLEPGAYFLFVYADWQKGNPEGVAKEFGTLDNVNRSHMELVIKKQEPKN
jgi:hypothetical protein